MIVLLALFACDTADTDTDTANSDAADATAEAAALWDEIQGYPSWDQTADRSGVKVSCDATHGPYVQIWYDPAAATLVDGSVSLAAEGATFVKEAYADDGTTIKSIAAMQKRAGFDADNGDWFWAMFNTAGNPTQSGSVSGCYGCHASGTDYVSFLSEASVDVPADCP